MRPEIRLVIKQEFGNPSDVDGFSDEFIEKIESLDIMFEGTYRQDTGIHSGVISFVDDAIKSTSERIVEEKLRELQQWIANHRFNPLILLWKEFEESDLE